MLEGMPQVDAGLVAVAVSVVGVIAGYAELKFKTGMNTDNIKEIKKEKLLNDNKVDSRFLIIEERHAALDTRVMDKLSNIEKIVANIQGQLNK